MEEKTYLCIDLKSFYASVECVERGLDPMTTNLVVADPERGRGTVCLAVSPSMKALGIRNRCRVYEIPEKVEYIMAPPRMNLYIAYAADVYAVYLKYLAKEDIHVYSVDEAFLDITHYGSLYRMGAGELAERIIKKGQEENVPLYKDNKLAHTLSKLEIGDTIPPELYDVVAEILVFVDDMDRLRSKLGR